MRVSTAESLDQVENAVSEARPLRAALWGGSGATGGEVLRQCLTEPRIGEVVVFTRRPVAVDSQDRGRVREVQLEDFLDLTPHRHALRNIDVVYWCLGVSQLTEPNAQRYRVITRDFAVAAAKQLREESPQAIFHFLSGMGSARNGITPVMWGRVKGEAEQALMDLELARLLIWRPTFIHAVNGRERPTRGDRMAEMFYLRAIPLLTNSTLNIAHAMLHTTFDQERKGTYGPFMINQLGRAYRRTVNQVQ